jgi:hypothetical protein
MRRWARFAGKGSVQGRLHKPVRASSVALAVCTLTFVACGGGSSKRTDTADTSARPELAGLIDQARRRVDALASQTELLDKPAYANGGTNADLNRCPVTLGGTLTGTEPPSGLDGNLYGRPDGEHLELRCLPATSDESNFNPGTTVIRLSIATCRCRDIARELKSDFDEVIDIPGEPKRPLGVPASTDEVKTSVGVVTVRAADRADDGSLYADVIWDANSQFAVFVEVRTSDLFPEELGQLVGGGVKTLLRSAATMPIDT